MKYLNYKAGLTLSKYKRRLRSPRLNHYLEEYFFEVQCLYLQYQTFQQGIAKLSHINLIHRY